MLEGAENNCKDMSPAGCNERFCPDKPFFQIISTPPQIQNYLPDVVEDGIVLNNVQKAQIRCSMPFIDFMSGPEREEQIHLNEAQKTSSRTRM